MRFFFPHQRLSPALVRVYTFLIVAVPPVIFPPCGTRVSLLGHLVPTRIPHFRDSLSLPPSPAQGSPSQVSGGILFTVGLTVLWVFLETISFRSPNKQH